MLWRVKRWKTQSMTARRCAILLGLQLGRGIGPRCQDAVEVPPLIGKAGLNPGDEQISGHFADRGMLMREGMIVDTTIIAAPPPIKNRAKARDPEMHQTKKGNEWYFGRTAHIGTVAASGLGRPVIVNRVVQISRFEQHTYKV
jgi:IS5 family transposase